MDLATELHNSEYLLITQILLFSFIEIWYDDEWIKKGEKRVGMFAKGSYPLFSKQVSTAWEN